MTLFAGYSVLITGGARGIGAGVAEAFANDGAQVVTGDVREPDGDAYQNHDPERGGGIAFRKLDVTSEEDWARVVSGIEADIGRLDILINGAGILMRGGLEETTLDEFRRVIDISQIGTFLGMKSCLPLLKARTDGVPGASIVNISSIGALRGAAGGMSYGASRAALVSMTRSAALDFAARNYAVRVNAVLPGSVKTQLSEHMYAELMNKGMSRDEAIGHMTDLHPLGRLGTTDDIAGAIKYFCSPAAAWVTGTSLVVDGGRTA